MDHKSNISALSSSLLHRPTYSFQSSPAVFSGSGGHYAPTMRTLTPPARHRADALTDGRFSVNSESCSGSEDVSDVDFDMSPVVNDDDDKVSERGECHRNGVEPVAS